jgi:alkane 1-monooxygenase
MIKNLDMHFAYEHIYGHHKRVATPEDPATAKYN